MVLRLRLSRVSTPGGAKRHHPRYNIVLAHARTARDSRPLEVLGTYNPIPEVPVGAEEGARKVKDVKVDVSRAKYWLGVGAQPSDTVWRLLSMIGLLEPKYLPTGPQTEKALKAVRFPTHQPSASRPNSRTAPDGPITQLLRSRVNPSTGTSASTSKSTSKSTQQRRRREEEDRDGGEIGAGTTSPADPNAA